MVMWCILFRFGFVERGDIGMESFGHIVGHIIPVTFQQGPFTYDAYGCSGTYTWMKSPGYTVNLSGMLTDIF